MFYVKVICFSSDIDEIVVHMEYYNIAKFFLNSDEKEKSFIYNALRAGESGPCKMILRHWYCGNNVVL